MKICFIPDLHLKDSLSSRVDKYGEAALRKLSFIYGLCGELDGIVFLGDIYDSVESVSADGSVRKRPVSYELESKFRSILDSRDFNYSLVGNHDIIGDSLSTLGFTGLGLNPLLDTSETLLFDDVVLMIHAYQDPAILSFDNSLVEYVALHGFVHETKKDIKNLWYSVSELKVLCPNLKGIFAGHDHTSYPVTDMLGVKVYRSSSLMRTDSSEASRMPRGFYTLDPDTGVVELVEVPSEPYDSIFLGKDTVKRVGQSNKKFIEKAASVDALGELKSVIESLTDVPVRSRVKTLLSNHGVSL